MTFTPPPFRPVSFLRNPHLQTFAVALLDRAAFSPQVEAWFISVAGEKSRVRRRWQPDAECRSGARPVRPSPAEGRGFNLRGAGCRCRGRCSPPGRQPALRMDVLARAG